MTALRQNESCQIFIEARRGCRETYLLKGILDAIRASEQNSYIPPAPAILAKMKFQYEDVELLFIDEISMVGSKKLSKINFRLQDFAEGENKLKFMGGRSLITSGN